MPDAGWFSPCDEAAATCRVLCLPGLGAGAAVFTGLARRAPAGAAVRGVRVPGRESRIGQPPIHDFAELTERLTGAVAALPPAPTILLGHCLGGLVQFEVARALRRRGHDLREVWVIGHPGPGGAVKFPADDPLGVYQALVAPPPEILRSPGLLDLVLRGVRADLDVANSYTPASHVPLDRPVRLFAGSDDPQLPGGDLTGWAGHAGAGLEVHPYRGDHRFAGAEPAVLALLRRLPS
ncbi:Surfactin synthase thioesterase subunit [Nonomuraea solani]|uniref:Surfactin synthase thioesterase subunit n=1 Tax=Nonomuraea solani TaxID=1144553 RepID=A0A1H6ETE1_9ACTN|nr:thioesterase domain-containing protein [Nonomuraea solani]SEH00205.1 Surfactin synthase thioesterase subunit [Nonomuraea solani]